MNSYDFSLFASTLQPCFIYYSTANDPFAAAFGPTSTSKQPQGSDPFGSDPFAPTKASGAAKAAASTQDDWFVSAQSPFRTPPKVDGVRMGSKAHKQVGEGGSQAQVKSRGCPCMDGNIWNSIQKLHL